MPTIEEALNHAWKIHQSGDLRGAEQIYRQVLAHDNRNANAWCFLGMTCHDQARYEEAVVAYRNGLQCRPNFPVALSNLGNTFKALGRLDEAVASCKEAIRLQPNYHTAYNNLGVALVSQGKLEEAAGCFESAIKFAPNDAVAHTNLSAALVKQGRFEEAQHNSEQAIRINPAYAEAHKNQGIVWLILGDFERGWDEYEWRWRCPGTSLPRYPQPLWDGSDIVGKTIMLHSEQGLGDTLHFMRYAGLLRRVGARVILQVQKSLLPVLQGFHDADVIIDPTTIPPPFDVHAPLMSLPRIMKTRLNNIPAEIPYLQADASLVEHWRTELAKLDGFKVGIAWQGSPSNHADKQRSVGLQQFAELAKIPGVTFVSLQKGLGSDQISSARAAIEVVDFGDKLDARGAFVDSAAIMMNLDLVIAVDTSIVHLAGALGVPVWIALNQSPDWRWLLHRADSPWYPSARLFRQSTLGDWDTVFGEMRIALEELVQRGGRTDPRAITEPIVSITDVPTRDATSEQIMSVASVMIRVSPGELIDKITILEIKAEHVEDSQQSNHVRMELDQLRDVFTATVPATHDLLDLTAQLKKANEELWRTEDAIRDCERRSDFGERFVELARSVYRQNDLRSALKRQINERLGAQIAEVKSYSPY